MQLPSCFLRTPPRWEQAQGHGRGTVLILPSVVSADPSVWITPDKMPDVGEGPPDDASNHLSKFTKHLFSDATVDSLGNYFP